MIHPLVLKRKGSTLLIHGLELQSLIDNPRPVLWCNDGLYGMLPIELVKNEISLINDRHYCKKVASIAFHWGEVVEIPQETGRAIEQYNEHNGGSNGKSIDSGGLPSSNSNPAAPIH